MGPVDGKLIAIDGTKLKANNSRKKYLNVQTFNKKIEYIDSKINEYTLAIEANSIEQNVDTINLPDTNIDIKEKLEEYKNRKKEFKIIKDNMKSKVLKQIAFTDPDSRGMKNNGKAEICYNVQIAVYGKNNLIIECDVVNNINDLNQLSNMALKAKKVLRKRKLNVVADAGYYNGEEIKICLDKKVKVYIKKSALNNSTGKVEFKKDKFLYVASEDKYICPQQKDLNFVEYSSKNGVKYKRYKGKDCTDCTSKMSYTTAKEGRNIQPWIHEEILESVENETNNNLAIYKKRKAIVEHPFGTIKET